MVKDRFSFTCPIKLKLILLAQFETVLVQLPKARLPNTGAEPVSNFEMIQRAVILTNSRRKRTITVYNSKPNPIPCRKQTSIPYDYNDPVQSHPSCDRFQPSVYPKNNKLSGRRKPTTRASKGNPKIRRSASPLDVQQGMSSVSPTRHFPRFLYIQASSVAFCSRFAGYAEQWQTCCTGWASTSKPSASGGQRGEREFEFTLRGNSSFVRIAHRRPGLELERDATGRLEFFVKRQDSARHGTNSPIYGPRAHRASKK